MLTALVRNWWMMVVRGGLAMAFGLVLLLSRRVTLDGLVLLFGVYAVLDGIWATVAARRASSRPLGAWPIALGGVVSVALGVLAIVGPFLAQSIVQLIAAWGLMVGGLEIIGALLTPRATARHWLLGSGGVWTVFLAVVVLALPHGDTDAVVRTLGIYALVFGVLVVLVARLFRHDMGGGSRAPI